MLALLPYLASAMNVPLTNAAAKALKTNDELTYTGDDTTYHTASDGVHKWTVVRNAPTNVQIEPDSGTGKKWVRHNAMTDFQKTKSAPDDGEVVRARGGSTWEGTGLTGHERVAPTFSASGSVIRGTDNQEKARRNQAEREDPPAAPPIQEPKQFTTGSRHMLGSATDVRSNKYYQVVKTR